MRSFLYRFFKLEQKNTSVRTELIAGLTSFATMAYIVIVAPAILSETGMDFRSVMIATVLAAFLSNMLIGFFGNYPFCLAPGMGLVAYFTYSVVQNDNVTWQTALGMCCISGIMLFALNFFRLTEKVMYAIPKCIRISTAAGIGLFLTFIGMQNTGIIVPHSKTIVSFGNPLNPSVILTIFGVIIITALLAKKIRGAMLLGILLNWAIGIATGLIEWNGLMDFPSFESSTFLAFEFDSLLNFKTLGVLLSFFFINLFDTSGTLMGLSEQAGFLNKKGKLPGVHKALYSNAVGTVGSSIFGTSPISFFVESASGIAEGGRSGLTSVVVGIFLFASLFFFPLASSIPPFATSPVLIVIGALMLRSVCRLDWEDPSEFIPAFLVLVTIPLTYSIATGLGMGFISYPFIKVLCQKSKDVSFVAWLLCAIFIFIFVIL